MPEYATDLHPIEALPTTDAAFRRAVADIALLAGGVMAGVDASLLAVPVPSGSRDDDMPLTLWNGRLAPCADRADAVAGAAIFSPVVESICLAADALFARLSTWRWTGARVPGLCIVTDGSGALLAYRQPGDPGDAAWLLGLAGRNGGAIQLLPLAEDGIWSLITAEAATIH